MEKILVNGFPRSGTTYLYFQLLKNFGNALSEPLNPDFLRITFKLNRDIVITDHVKLVHRTFSTEDLKHVAKVQQTLLQDRYLQLLYKHPNKDGFYRWLYDSDTLLVDYLKLLADFHIKEISLHLYLNHPFIRENWEVYHIIRHPIDTFASLCNIITKENKIHKIVLLLIESNPPLKRLISFIRKAHIDFHNIVKNCHLLARIVRYSDNFPITFPECFVYAWTVSNYIAINSLPKDHIIVYEKPETYKQLPFELKDKLKIKIYPHAREDLQYKFERIVEQYGLEYEYNKLMKLFE